MSCQDVCFYGDPEMRVLAEALGAVAVGPAVTFWLYDDADGRWCVQREGEAEAHQFHKRDDALNFVRVSAVRSPSHRLVLKAPQRRGIARRRHPTPSHVGRDSARGWRGRLINWLRAIPWHAGNA